MSDIDLDGLQAEYKRMADVWVGVIRAEEALATPDHTMSAMESWDTAGLALHDAELNAKKARDAYKNALRRKNYGF